MSNELQFKSVITTSVSATPIEVSANEIQLVLKCRNSAN